MKRVLILGAGFGGIATARRLKQTLDEKDEVILVDRRSHFMVGFRKTWALVGQRLSADALVVALGAELAPETIPGFQQYAYNVYDPNDIPRAAQALQDF